MTRPKSRNDAVSLQNTFEIEKKSVFTEKQPVQTKLYVIPTKYTVSLKNSCRKGVDRSQLYIPPR